MNRLFQILNFFGVLVLSVLCVIQWQINSRLNRQACELESVRQAQCQQLEENNRTIKGQAADLDEFRQRLTLAESQLKEQESKLNLSLQERNQLAGQCGQLRSALSQWMAAVAKRDTVIKKAIDQIQQLTNQRNEAIAKLNDLIGKYNTLAKSNN